MFKGSFQIESDVVEHLARGEFDLARFEKRLLDISDSEWIHAPIQSKLSVQGGTVIRRYAREPQEIREVSIVAVSEEWLGMRLEWRDSAGSSQYVT